MRWATGEGVADGVAPVFAGKAQPYGGKILVALQYGWETALGSAPSVGSQQ